MFHTAKLEGVLVIKKKSPADSDQQAHGFYYGAFKDRKMACARAERFLCIHRSLALVYMGHPSTASHDSHCDILASKLYSLYYLFSHSYYSRSRHYVTCTHSLYEYNICQVHQKKTDEEFFTL